MTQMYADFFCKSGFHDGDSMVQMNIADSTRIHLARMLNAEFRRQGLRGRAFEVDMGCTHNTVQMAIIDDLGRGDDIVSSWSRFSPPHPEALTYWKILDSVGAEWQRRFWNPAFPKRLSRKARRLTT